MPGCGGERGQRYNPFLVASSFVVRTGYPRVRLGPRADMACLRTTSWATSNSRMSLDHVCGTWNHVSTVGHWIPRDSPGGIATSVVLMAQSVYAEFSVVLFTSTSQHLVARRSRIFASVPFNGEIESPDPIGNEKRSTACFVSFARCVPFLYLQKPRRTSFLLTSSAGESFCLSR